MELQGILQLCKKHARGERISWAGKDLWDHRVQALHSRDRPAPLTLPGPALRPAAPGRVPAPRGRHLPPIPAGSAGPRRARPPCASGTPPWRSGRPGRAGRAAARGAAAGCGGTGGALRPPWRRPGAARGAGPRGRAQGPGSGAGPSSARSSVWAGPANALGACAWQVSCTAAPSGAIAHGTCKMRGECCFTKTGAGGKDHDIDMDI